MSTTMINDETYVLRHDELWFYYLSRITVKGGLDHFEADGVPMERAHEPDWFTSTSKANQIVAVGKPTKVLTHYTLRDPEAASVKFPLTISADEMVERLGGEDLWETEYASLYERQYRAEENVERLDVVTPERELVGVPSPRHPGTWANQLPFQLRWAAPYRHLFPGTLHGIRGIVLERIKSMPHIADVYNHNDGFHVYVWQEWTVPQQGVVPGKTKRSKDRKVTTTRKKQSYRALPLPNSVAADCKANAIKEFDAIVDEWVAWFASLSITKLCGHCKGEGIIKVNPPEVTT